MPADDTDAAVAADGAVAAGAKAWKFHGDEHPCWAIPRVSPSDVMKSKATSEPIEINRGLQTKRLQRVIVGNFKDTPVESQNIVTVDVPFLVNLKGLANGTHLYWEEPAKQKPTQDNQNMSWKHAVQQSAKQTSNGP